MPSGLICYRDRGSGTYFVSSTFFVIWFRSAGHEYFQDAGSSRLPWVQRITRLERVPGPRRPSRAERGWGFQSARVQVQGKQPRRVGSVRHGGRMCERAECEYFAGIIPRIVQHQPKVPCMLNLRLPRVINFTFLLQRHQKYNITQYGELGFS